MLLFAARTSQQESLRFSPFELVFGHTVRGPLKLLKENLLFGNSESINILQYVSDFHTKLFRACELARANLSSSQRSMKKQTQSWHVNMLKPYVERSSDVVLQPVNVNVVVSEPKEELGNELNSNRFSPTDTITLTNTDVLWNLDSKLSYLSESQRQDLEKLLLEFEHLFPDVPTRTDQIYHHVYVGNSD